MHTDIIDAHATQRKAEEFQRLYEEVLPQAGKAAEHEAMCLELMGMVEEQNQRLKAAGLIE